MFAEKEKESRFLKIAKAKLQATVSCNPLILSETRRLRGVDYRLLLDEYAKWKRSRRVDYSVVWRSIKNYGPRTG